MALDRAYILFGLVWLFAGMGFGIYMGVSEQFHLANTHAHANLLGFVVSVLYGLIHRGWPALRQNRNAVFQITTHQSGTLLPRRIQIPHGQRADRRGVDRPVVLWRCFAVGGCGGHVLDVRNGCRAGRQAHAPGMRCLTSSGNRRNNRIIA